MRWTLKLVAECRPARNSIVSVEGMSHFRIDVSPTPASFSTMRLRPPPGRRVRSGPKSLEALAKRCRAQLDHSAVQGRRRKKSQGPGFPGPCSPLSVRTNRLRANADCSMKRLERLSTPRRSHDLAPRVHY
jgi:hypothetical protein